MYKSFLLRTFYGVYTYIYISSGVKNTMAYRTNFNTCYTAFWFSGVSTHTRYSGMSQPPPRRPSCRPRVPTRRPLGSGRTTHRRATLFLILKFYVSTAPPPPHRALSRETLDRLEVLWIPSADRHRRLEFPYKPKNAARLFVSPFPDSDVEDQHYSRGFSSMRDAREINTRIVKFYVSIGSPRRPSGVGSRARRRAVSQSDWWNKWEEGRWRSETAWESERERVSSRFLGDLPERPTMKRGRMDSRFAGLSNSEAYSTFVNGSEADRPAR